MAGLMLGFAAGDTVSADRDAPLGSNTLVLCDGIEAAPTAGSWTPEIVHRAGGRVVAILRTTTRVRQGMTLQVPGAERVAAVAIDPADGAQVTIYADGSRVLRLADWTRSL